MVNSTIHSETLSGGRFTLKYLNVNILLMSSCSRLTIGGPIMITLALIVRCSRKIIFTILFYMILWLGYISMNNLLTLDFRLS